MGSGIGNNKRINITEKTINDPFADLNRIFNKYDTPSILYDFRSLPIAKENKSLSEYYLETKYNYSQQDFNYMFTELMKDAILSDDFQLKHRDPKKKVNDSSDFKNALKTIELNNLQISIAPETTYQIILSLHYDNNHVASVLQNISFNELSRLVNDPNAQVLMLVLNLLQEAFGGGNDGIW